MARWTGTWMSGPSAAGVQPAEQDAPGQRLGLPADGPGSAAGTGRRAGAFLFDAIASGLVARLVDPIDTSGTLNASEGLLPVVILTVVYVVGLLLTGQTPGMRLLGLRVTSVGGRALGMVPVLLRTALLLLLVPAVISDRDGRGLHDRAAGTVVVRA